MSLVKKAKIFATNAHNEIEQKRKYTNGPYIVHPASVASRVSKVTSDEKVIAAAWLHDTVEDTNVTLEEIKEKFGEAVYGLVESLTDISKPDDGNRKARKLIDLEHTKAASPAAKTVKLADLIDNSESIIKYSESFAPVFISEMEKLLTVLGEGNKKLFVEAEEIVRNYKLNKP